MEELQDNRFYKLSEVSRVSGIPHVTLALYARTGVIKALKVGKMWRVKGRDFKDFLEHGTDDTEFLK